MAALSASAPAQAMEVSDVPLYRSDGCERSDVEADLVVVCGRREENERYRLPPRFRNDTAGARDSWMVRGRDELQRSRFADQAIGPFGYLQRRQELNYLWRKERDEMARESAFDAK